MAANIFNNLINKIKRIMNDLHKSVDKNKLYFKYVGPTENVTFYEYYDSEELFNETKNNRLRFGDALKKQEGLLRKINELKIGKKLLNKKK